MAMDDLRARFLEGMSRAATFVAVATTDGDGGRAGVTVSSLTSVSADGDQPSLLACLHHQSPAAAAILKNRAFAACLLAEDQQALSDLFAGRGGTDHAARFDRGSTITDGDRSFIDICQVDCERLSRRTAVAGVSSNDDRMAAAGLKVEQRAIGNSDDSSGAVDRKSTTSAVVE